jgi:uridine kinase
MQNSGRVIVVGVCGPSASGKSTLCEHLNKHFGGKPIAPFNVFCLDEYANMLNVRYALQNAPNREELEIELQHPKFGINWEHPVIYDAKEMIKHMKEALSKYNRQQNSYLFVEGFLLYHYDEILPMVDVKIFLDGSCDILRQRRMTRKWNNCTREMWDDLIWPEFEKRRHGMIEKADIILDGALELNAIIEEAIQEIHSRSNVII